MFFVICDGQIGCVMGHQIIHEQFRSPFKFYTYNLMYLSKDIRVFSSFWIV